jgi:archaellum component FlaC
MLSLDEDLEKIKELENTINDKNNDFQKIKEILNKYETDINLLKTTIENIKEFSHVSLTLILMSYSYENPIHHIIFSIFSCILIYKSIFIY